MDYKYHQASQKSELHLREHPAIEPTAQPSGHVYATFGPATGSPTAKPKLGASYLKFELGQGYLQDIRHLRQCCGRPVLRAEESVEGVSLHGVCMPRVTHPALDRRVRNHVLGERFGAPTNGPVWIPVPFR